LFDLPYVIHPPLLSSLIFAVAAVVGLVARKRSIDIALVRFYVLGILGSFVSMNDHETMMETVRGLTQQQG
jgi:hypothetical protein